MAGPLNKLISSSNTLKNLSYPSDLGSSRTGHWIMFTVSLPQKSTYQQKSGSSVVGGSSFSAIAGNIDKINNSVSTVTNSVSNITNIGQTFASTASNALSSAWDSAKHLITTPQDISFNYFSGSDAKNIASSLGTAGGSLIDAVNSSWEFLMSPPTTKPVGYIQLYMPDTVSMEQRMQYNSLNMTEAFGNLGIAAESSAEGASLYDSVKDAGSFGQALRSAGAHAPPVAVDVMANLGESAGLVNSGDAVSRFALNKMGNAINPQMEVTFTQIDFRNFQYNFSFTPKNKDEAATVRDIIRMFRAHAAPEMEGPSKTSGRYSIVPSVFKIDYIFNGAQNKNLHQITTCALKSIVVDYAQEVGWVTFDDGMPVKTYMTLNFQETEILTKQKIDEGF